MSDYVWLCKYGSHYVTETYGMVIQTTEFDGVERFFLEQKRKYGHINDAELQRLEHLKKSILILIMLGTIKSIWKVCQLRFLKNWILIIIICPIKMILCL